MQKRWKIKLACVLIGVMFCHIFFVKGHLLPVDAFDWLIIRDIRLPRTILGFLTGFILAITGAVFQTIFNNKLADSFTLGIAGGASLGSALAVVIGISAAVMSVAGSLLTLLAVVLLTQLYFRHEQRTGMILFGMFINFFCSSALYGLVILWPGQSRQLLNYLFGSIGTAEWQNIYVLIPVTLIGLAVLLKLARPIMIVASGETIARGVGVEQQKVEYTALIISSIMTAVLVSITGIIGFVGLIVPQFFKQTTTLLITGIVGGIAVIAADFLGNNMLTPLQIPVSVLLSLVGLPLLMMIMLKKEWKRR
ncbi:FecCD family ABC transporter permease [Macrococcus brunensis]|uniref:FecCD family ABC transporter permease n=1 Tax=Macrococcus brunensis TaxID=198483 RepID=UPI001EF10816|nr:iron ABC transporter permease [Macrococcus brunensis]ULG71764.1 iron ABC transporter permease [Macrococcus brunensis]ULG74022.1 iron ABC transporter permease [Macrococcus brunensis]